MAVIGDQAAFTTLRYLVYLTVNLDAVIVAGFDDIVKFKISAEIILLNCSYKILKL